jgi:hypothetical protein
MLKRMTRKVPEPKCVYWPTVLAEVWKHERPANFLFQILKITPNFLDVGAIGFRIAITEKLLITAMQGFKALGMFNRAPELFRASSYFLQISE